MFKDLWINLPVKDINISIDFFTKLGFTFNPQHANSGNSACLLAGEKKTVIMLFEESVFKSFTNKDITDTSKSREVLLSIGANSKEAVDEIARKAIESGGNSNHKASEMTTWMYACNFSDPDGHMWNVLYMDMDKMQKI